MKKALAILLALVMVLSLSVTAFAADSGSITITNATIGNNYAIYKVFDATYSTNADNVTEAVSYTISNNNPFFEVLFGADGTTPNTYFTYNASTGAVTKNKDVNDSELTKYLNDLVKPDADGAFTAYFAPTQKQLDVQSDTVVFNGVDYGYYLVASSMGTTVTITSNTPNVEIIDKNQKPATTYSKEILVSGTIDENPGYATKNSAAIGDAVTYKISFVATNYDGNKKIKDYRVHDVMGSSLWLDVDSIQVVVGGTPLTRGYYLDYVNVADTVLGTWEDWDSAQTKTVNDAEFYLVQESVDSFRVTIPWVEEHWLEGVPGDYVVKADMSKPSRYVSPVDVEVYYTAYVEADAVVGKDSTRSTTTNKANINWTCEYESGSTGYAQVYTDVYGIGILKDDATTSKNLPGAVFRLYGNYDADTKTYDNPIYLLPTGTEGVYVVDSDGSALSNAVAANNSAYLYDTVKTSRTVYADKVAAYLNGADHENYVVTPVNGKVVILGLDAGTYYLQETQAPDGYNSLTAPVTMVSNEVNTNFAIFANAKGQVADIQEATAEYAENFYLVTHLTVSNSKGMELPSTGGEGAIMLITIGAVVAMAFAVLLITQKKMSIYKD